jgi:hypothetical protein
MTAVRALLGRLIDHAALFPPASMAMPEAMEADRRARASDHAWMLDRFIVPASKLGELPADAPRLSVVLDGGEGDLEAVAEAIEAGREVELVEARIDVAWIPETQALVREKLPGVRAFWELPPGRGLRGEVAAVREAGGGAKIRCGGETVPSVADVAAFIDACRDAGIAFKATAGLHHPIRSGDRHGFLNLLAAAVFGDGDTEAIVAEQDPEAFVVDAAGFEVHGHRAGVAEIEAARAELFVAFGSCSFDEPVEDLTALGVLGPR